MHLTLISFFLLKPKETYQRCQMRKLRPLILHRQSNNQCQNHTALRWPLKPTCQSVEWSQSAVLRGTAHNHSEIKSKQCVRDSHRNSLSLGDSHTRWVTAAHPLTHNYTLQLGEWERGPGRRNNSFSVRVGWDFHFGGVPCGKHVTFLFDNYCWRWTVARKPLNPAKYRAAPGYCCYKHLKVTIYTSRSQDPCFTHWTGRTK